MLFQENYENPTNVITSMVEVLTSLKSSDHLIELCLSISRNATFILRHQTFSVLYTFCSLLVKFPECVPCNDNFLSFFDTVLDGVYCGDELPPEENALQKLTVVGEVVEGFWKVKSNYIITVKCIKKVLNKIASGSVSRTLGVIFQRFPHNVMASAITELTEPHVMSDTPIKNIVSHLVKWLLLPHVRNISDWAILLMHRLVEARRFQLLNQLAEANVRVVCVSES